ncbi:hypothetical protein JHN63_36705 [Streptomyces sp. MBT65]|uniref:hypothetical protein n=1 Tax=Streptomyces sp. MBT65 TaxID=1488395 RepID=UPI001909493C|nr:hypothetical protein [Streptomyces sp. MBT65]MBK3579249.1 hypothetical protein [Streptomyces sp. MBT65]
MHPRDKEIWLAIDQGLRAIDWEAWFGCPEGANYLSPAGHEVTTRAVAGLTAFFQSRWLPKAVTPLPASGKASDTFVGLGRAAPVLQIMNGAEPGAWVEAVRWWAAYAYLEEAEVPGLTSVRRDARRDVTLSRFLHTQTQARLALIGAARGLPVELEPTKASGGPGDVRIGPVFIEVVTFAEDQKLQDYERFRQSCGMHLRTLERDLDIYWEGDFPELLNGDDFQTWKKRTEEAAQHCAASEAAVDVLSSAGRRLTVNPGRAPQGTTLTGETVESDQGKRLLGKVRGKCAKTQGAGTAWIWVEDHSGLFHFPMPFADFSLAAKTDALADLLGPLLGEYVHVAGIIVSNAARRRQPLPLDEDALRPAAQGFRRGLPLDRVRETIVIPRRIILPEQTNLIARMCDAEAASLDWALGRLGVSGGVTSLLTDSSTPRRVSPLWTP